MLMPGLLEDLYTLHMQGSVRMGSPLLPIASVASGREMAELLACFGTFLPNDSSIKGNGSA